MRSAQRMVRNESPPAGEPGPRRLTRLYRSGSQWHYRAQPVPVWEVPCGWRHRVLARFPHRRFGDPLQATSDYVARYRPLGAARSLRRRKLSNGELLLGFTVLELLQFGLVMALGLLPLAIVHWVDPMTSLDGGQFTRRFRLPHWVKTGPVAMIAQWLTDLLS